MILRGTHRGDVVPWEGSHTTTQPATWTPQGSSGGPQSRTRYKFGNATVLMMGVCDGPRAVPGAQLIPGWRPADDDSRHPTAEQLQQAREAEHYAKIKKEILNSIRMLVAQYELTIQLPRDI